MYENQSCSHNKQYKRYCSLCDKFCTRYRARGGIGCPLWTFTTQHLIDTYQFVYSEPYACHINFKTHVKYKLTNFFKAIDMH